MNARVSDSELVNAVENLTKQTARFHTNIERRIEDLEQRTNAGSSFFFGGGNNVSEAKKAAADFIRGREVKAGFLETGSDSGGGYTVQPEYSRQITKKLFDRSPIRSLARIVEIDVGSEFVEPVDVSDADAQWVSENQARGETFGAEFDLNRVPLNEMYALIRATQRLLDDSQFDLATWVEEKLLDRFARLEGQAFVSGNGMHRPKGFLSYPTSASGDSTRAANAYQYVPSGSATGLTADAIIDLIYSLRAPYRDGAVVVMNTDTARRVRQLKDGAGNYLIVPGLALDQPDRLCGLPVKYDENLPDVAAGSTPIVVASWRRAYLIVDRPGIRWLRDPFSIKPHVALYSTRRVGGQSTGDFDALKIMKVGTA